MRGQQILVLIVDGQVIETLARPTGKVDCRHSLEGLRPCLIPAAEQKKDHDFRFHGKDLQKSSFSSQNACWIRGCRCVEAPPKSSSKLIDFQRRPPAT